MKKIIVLSLLLVFATASFSQQSFQKQSLLQTDYLKKSKHQKTAAWILTGAGTAGLAITLASDATRAIFSIGTVEPEYKSYAVPYLLSAACVVGGIYLFIASSKNKKKAKAASAFINMEKVPVLHGTSVINQSFPVIGVKIKI